METNKTILEKQEHPFEAEYFQESKVLILGSFPSVKSRQLGFYYGHPKNRFWKVLAAITNEAEPITIEDKKALLKKHKIALWDVLKTCTIKGSSDQSIKNAVANDIQGLLKKTNIQAIFTTGKKAHSLYEKYCYPITGRKDFVLPSTSPANCAYKEEDLIKEYEIIKKFLL